MQPILVEGKCSLLKEHFW